jgi:hypothetical protein
MKLEDGLDAVTRILAGGELQQQIAYSANLHQQSNSKNVLGFYADDATDQFATDQFTKMVMDTYQLQGIRAFETTKRGTALHEAGHTVISTVLGRKVSRTRIKRARKQQPIDGWTGHTYDGVVDLIGPDSSVENDLNFARSIIAGLISEITFDRADYRAGSSLDEIIQFQLAINNVATKAQRADGLNIALEQMRWVGGALIANKVIVHEIADLLMRRGTLRGVVLEKILRRVRLEGGGSREHSPKMK